MWNLKCSNKTCEKFDTFKTHKEHIERLYQTKSTIDNKAPKTPKFFQERAKKGAMELKRNRKIEYENRVLITKMKEIDYKPSPYSVSEVKPFECLAFNRSISGYNVSRKKRDIEKMNKKLQTRFIKTKTCYPTSEFLKDHRYNQYLESNLSENRVNPYINYATFSQFKKNLITIEREVVNKPYEYNNYKPDVQLNDYNNNCNPYQNDNEENNTLSLTQLQSRPISSKTFCTDYRKLISNKTKNTITTNSNTYST